MTQLEHISGLVDMNNNVPCSWHALYHLVIKIGTWFVHLDVKCANRTTEV